MGGGTMGQVCFTAIGEGGGTEGNAEKCRKMGGTGGKWGEMGGMVGNGETWAACSYPLFFGGATMGQVCFTAISSNRACPTVFIALSSVCQIIVLCARCPSVQWLGVRAKVPSSLHSLYQVSCRLLGCRLAMGGGGGVDWPSQVFDVR